MFFVIKLGTCMAEEALIEAKFIEAKVLNGVFFMSGDSTEVWLDLIGF
jgi:hypothetical protein